jgi:glucose-1-phosphatase
MFLCGHDSNLASIGAAPGFQFPETENALELHTPIGSKLVFEKWSDGTDDYVAINMVYQTVTQLQGRSLLSLTVPPMVMPVKVQGLTANSDGLYRLADLDARMAGAMAEYEAIEDVPASVRTVEAAQNPAAIYNLQGQQLEGFQRGVHIVGGKKIVQ